LKKIEPALVTGETLIIENVGESIDAILNPILFREVYTASGDKYIKFNDN